jgi:hypothetical protein
MFSVGPVRERGVTRRLAVRSIVCLRKQVDIGEVAIVVAAHRTRYCGGVDAGAYSITVYVYLRISLANAFTRPRVVVNCGGSLSPEPRGVVTLLSYNGARAPKHNCAEPRARHRSQSLPLELLLVLRLDRRYFGHVLHRFFGSLCRGRTRNASRPAGGGRRH